MSTLDDLNNLGIEFLTVDEWFNRFTPEEQETITEAIRRYPPGKVWEILINLEENPYPFKRPTFNSWARQIRLGGSGA